jgi:hypothetical protein
MVALLSIAMLTTEPEQTMDPRQALELSEMNGIVDIVIIGSI